MKWLIALDSLLYIGAIVLFFAGLGLISAICLIVGVVLTFIMVGGNNSGSSTLDSFSWYMLFDSITDLFD